MLAEFVLKSISEDDARREAATRSVERAQTLREAVFQSGILLPELREWGKTEPDYNQSATTRKISRRPATREGIGESLTSPSGWDIMGDMGKVAKTPRRAGARNPRDIPNRETGEAMASVERGEGVVCKDVDDLLKKLKS